MIGSPVRGAPRVMMYDLVAGMDRSRWQPAVAFVREGAEEAERFGVDSMLPDFKSLGVPLCLAGIEAPIDTARGLHRLNRFLRTNRVKLIVTHIHRADTVGAALGWWGRAHTVRVLHSFETWWSPTTRGFGALRRRIDQLVNRQASQIVCVSEDIRRRVIAEQGVPAEKVTLVPGGIDVHRFRLAELPFPGTRPPTIGTVTRLLADAKGLNELVDAAAELARTHPTIRCVIAGDGPDRAALEARAAANAAPVHFLGHVTDVPAFLAGIDIFVLPSRQEGTPYSVIEAMAAGRTIVVTETGGLPDLIDDGRSGRVVPVGDSTGLATAVDELLTDIDRSRNYAAAALADSAGYSKAVLLQRWETIYAGVLEGR
jgi:glycosyltransferase involved in cell wall biosynthesis